MRSIRRRWIDPLLIGCTLAGGLALLLQFRPWFWLAFAVYLLPTLYLVWQQRQTNREITREPLERSPDNRRGIMSQTPEDRRYQVTLDPDLLRPIQLICATLDMSVADWVNNTLRPIVNGQSKEVEKHIMLPAQK